MRIGFCTNMMGASPGDTGADYIERIAAVGFDYLEMPVAEMSLLDDDAFDALVQRVENSGIRCEACNNFFPRDMRLTGPNPDTEAIKAYIPKMMKRLGRLGISSLVFGSGPAKTAPEGFPLEQAFEQVAEVARLAAPIAEQYGITIVIEPLRRQECNLINSYEEGCRLVREVSLPNVRGLVDYFHLTQEGEPAEHIVKDASLLHHAHFARNEGRSFPSELAEEDTYGAFIGALKEAGYTGRLSLEAYTGNFDDEAPRALAFMRKYFS